MLEDRTLPSTVTNLMDDGSAGSLRSVLAATPAGGLIDFQAGLQGSILLQASRGALAISHNVTIVGPDSVSVSISGNHAIEVLSVASGTTVSIQNLTVRDGMAVQGGGILNHGTLTLNGVAFVGNMATMDGGGVWNDGTFTATNTTWSGNATAAGGHGAGLFDAHSATITLTNDTIANNTVATGAGGQGGGVFLDTMAVANLKNTIIATNTAPAGPDIFGTVAGMTPLNNLIGDGTGSSGITNGQNGNRVGTAGMPINPMLGMLQANGGPTATLALLAGSPAIDAGTNTGITFTTDQRGFQRIVGAAIDIGAYEYQPPATMTMLTSSLPTASVNQEITFTVVVQGTATGSNTPTGLVDFMDGSLIFGTVPLRAGRAIFTINSLMPRTSSSITAVYHGVTQGDFSFSMSTSNVVNQVINRGATTLALTATPNPSGPDTVTFTARVTPSLTGPFVPGGMVTFMDGTTSLGSANLTNGQAVLTHANFTPGTHSITAHYVGDTNFVDSMATVMQVVNQFATLTMLQVSPMSPGVNQTVMLNATVTPVGTSMTPTGTVTFLDGTSTLGTAMLASGHAMLSVPTLTGGNHMITARYEGSGPTFGGSSATMPVSVAQDTVTTMLMIMPTMPTFGQTVTFTITIGAHASGPLAPTGTVDITEGSTTIGTGTISSGQVIITTSTLTAGMHSPIIRYRGDTNFQGQDSSFGSFAVSQAATMVMLASAPNPSVLNQPVVFTAHVSAMGVTAMPTGSVDFVEGSMTLGTANLVNGVASFTTSSLGIGTHSITAHYRGDTNFQQNTSSAVSQVVAAVGTTQVTVTLTNMPNMSTVNQPVTFMATVAGVGTGIVPTGTVQFREGTTVLGTATLMNGHGTVMIASLPAGSHSIVAHYDGDAMFAVGDSMAQTQTVARAASTTMLTISPNPSTMGQQVTFTASVVASTMGPLAPTGMVSFLEGTTVLGTAMLMNGQATFQISTQPLGTHAITARYESDSNFLGSSSPVVMQSVNQFMTMTMLDISPPSSMVNQPVTFTATVVAIGSAPPPIGTVTFLEGTTVLGTGTLSNGRATLMFAGLTGGMHTVTARYEGSDPTFGSSSGTHDITVARIASQITLDNMPTTSMLGQIITLTATVTPTLTGPVLPGGTVTFLDGTTVLGTAQIMMGHAVFMTSALGLGTHSLTARYEGDVSFTGMTSAARMQTVTQGMATVMLDSMPNPSLVNQAITLTASVTAPGAPVMPTGMVTFLEGTRVLGTAMLTMGQATLMVSNLSAGTHLLTVRYEGDMNFLMSTSAAHGQVVNQAMPMVTLDSSPNPSNVSAAVTFTATITVSGTAFLPTGTITFLDGTTVLGTGMISNGHATFMTSMLAGGTHIVTARYDGDSNFTMTTSAPRNQVVNPITPTITLTNVPTSSTVNQSVSFTVQVSASGGVVPTGMVTLLDGTMTLATGTLSNGRVVIAVANLTAGAHSITARYQGDASYMAVTSSAVTETVAMAGTMLVLTSVPFPPVTGQSLTLTATVTPSTSGPLAPTGTVSFFDNGVSLGGAVTLSGTTASFTISNFTSGPHNITATYSGDANFLTSSGTLPNQVTNPVSTVTVVTTSINPGRVGQAITFTATVTPSMLSSHTPTGTVTFLDNGVALGAAVSLSGTTATFTTSSLSAGRHVITARYSGDMNFQASTSAELDQTVRSFAFFAIGGTPGHVQVRRIADGSLVADFQPFGSSYTGAVNVAVGDVNGDGTDDIVVAAGAGSPHVKVYDGRAFANGTFNTSNPDASLLASFFAYGTQYDIGATVAVGNVTNTGYADIITGASAGNPHVKVYRGQAIANGTFGANPEGALWAQFFAYAQGQNLGVNVAAGDVTHSGVADLITAPTGGSPHVKIYNGQDVATGSINVNPESQIRASFVAFTTIGVGAFVAAGDTTGNGFADVIVGAGGGNPNIRVFSGQAIAQGTANPNSNVLDDFFAFNSQTHGGVAVGAADFEGTGRYDILAGLATGSPHYRVVSGHATGNPPPAVNGIDNTISGLQGGIAVGA